MKIFNPLNTRQYYVSILYKYFRRYLLYIFLLLLCYIPRSVTYLVRWVCYTVHLLLWFLFCSDTVSSSYFSVVILLFSYFHSAHSSDKIYGTHLRGTHHFVLHRSSHEIISLYCSAASQVHAIVLPMNLLRFFFCQSFIIPSLEYASLYSTCACFYCQISIFRKTLMRSLRIFPNEIPFRVCSSKCTTFCMISFHF